MVIMKDVAEEAGVSIATVSHVINETKFVAKPTKEKVLKAMNKLNYSPDKVAQSLRKKETGIIGLLVPDISNFFFSALAFHIENELKRNGYKIILGNSNENLDEEKDQFQILSSYRIDGAIIAPAEGSQDYLNLIKDMNNIPILAVDRKPSDFNCTSVLVNNFVSSYNAIRRLIHEGYEKIGIITGPRGLTTTKERLGGYKSCFNDFNIKFSANYIKVGNYKYDAGYKLTSELIKETDISALFVTNNLMCIGAINYLNEHNISIPDDLALLGFDDYKWASTINPPLSVVKQPVERIGKKAARVLTKKLSNSHNSRKHEVNFREIRLNTEFIKRKSF